MANPVSDAPAPPAEAVSPVGINHIVLNVRDIEELHKFWTEIVGLKQVATLRQQPDRPQMPKMRFYSAVNGGKVTHHTVALVESPNLPPPAEWVLADGSAAINHVAMQMPSREAWQKQLTFSAEPRDQVQLARQPWRDAQRLHQRPQRLRRRIPLRIAARDVGKRYPGRDRLSRKPADRGAGSSGRSHRLAELRAKGAGRGSGRIGEWITPDGRPPEGGRTYSRHSGAARSAEPGTHEHGNSAASHDRRAVYDPPVFMGSGFAGPGMTATRHRRGDHPRRRASTIGPRRGRRAPSRPCGSRTRPWRRTDRGRTIARSRRRRAGAVHNRSCGSSIS